MMPDDARDASDPVWDEIRKLRSENEELRRGLAVVARVIGELTGPPGWDELAARRQRHLPARTSPRPLARLAAPAGASGGAHRAR